MMTCADNFCLKIVFIEGNTLLVCSHNAIITFQRSKMLFPAKRKREGCRIFLHISKLAHFCGIIMYFATPTTT